MKYLRITLAIPVVILLMSSIIVSSILVYIASSIRYGFKAADYNVNIFADEIGGVFDKFKKGNQ